MLVVLASQSPRRREILTFAGIPHRVQVAGVEEIRAAGEPAAEYVKRLARDKARAVDPGPDEIVLAADTTVVVDSHGDEIVLEKPVDSSDAKRMIELLSGRTHRVLTGICLRTAYREIVEVAQTIVQFAALTEQEIDDYVASGEPLDKAGGYAIQGRAAKFVQSLNGCYFNVVGLPVALVYQHLKTFQY